VPRWRPGSVTSSASALQLALELGVGQCLAARGSAASMACLAWLMAAPRVFFSSTGSAAMPFISSVMRPLLPRYWALAFSSSAGVGRRELGARSLHQCVEVVHVNGGGKKKGRPEVTAFESSPQPL
jgi:hypothetical protein